MHPELYLVVYRQRERELEHRLEHLRSQQQRTEAVRRPSARRVGVPHLTQRLRNPVHA